MVFQTSEKFLFLVSNLRGFFAFKEKGRRRRKPRQDALF